MNSLKHLQRLIQHSTVPPNAVIQLLKDTCIGTNGTLYRLLDTEQKIHLLHQPLFIYLIRNQYVLGNLTLCKRTIKFFEENVTAHYIRYVAFTSSHQASLKKGKGNSSIHDYFKTLFQTDNLNPFQPSFNKSIFWAYIDPENTRSFNLNENLGFETIGHFKTRTFSRVNPKIKGSIERLTSNEQQEVLDLTSRFYKFHAFFSPVHLFKSENYFVLKENGAIVCGIQANPVHWKIESLPGLSGKLLLKMAPRLPLLKKLIVPNNHRFLATEGIFWKKGYAHRVSDLLEGVLAITNHHSLLIMRDEHDTKIDDLNIKWGFIERIKKDSTIDIVAKLNGYTKQEITLLKNTPKYLSGFDIT